MRTVVLIAEMPHLTDLKDAIRGPLSGLMQAQIQRMVAELPSSMSIEERSQESERLNRKRRQLQFLSVDSYQDAISRCRGQEHHWMPPYFIVIQSMMAGSQIARSLFHGLVPEHVSDIVTLSNPKGMTPSAIRQESGILSCVGTMTDRLIRKSVLEALLSFAIDDRVQSRISMSSTSSVRPPSMLSSSVSISA